MTDPVDPVLIVAWLVFAHLVADFVLQNDWIAINKGRGTRTGWAALGLHGLHVALCLVPVALAFGGPGIAYLAVVSVSHMAVDRWKVRATRRADARAQARARDRVTRGEEVSETGLGAAWSAWPGMLFVADQVLHLAIAIVGWLVILDGMSLLPGFVDVVNAIVGRWDPSVVNATVLWGVVVLSLFLANTRGGFYFTMALASPRHLRPEPADASGATAVRSDPGAGTPVRVSATIAALERLLIVALVLAGSLVGALLVVAFDVAARWRDLADRDYADGYLLGTLASASVALGTALLAAAALATLG